MALKKCKECGNEISTRARTCPSCGADQRNFFSKHKIITVLGVLIIFVFIISLGGEDKKPSVSNVSQQEVDEKVYANIGDAITTEKFEIVVSVVEKRKRVGTDIFANDAPEGAIFLAIQWQCKNISDEPISSGKLPRIKLLDSGVCQVSCHKLLKYVFAKKAFLLPHF